MNIEYTILKDTKKFTKQQVDEVNSLLKQLDTSVIPLKFDDISKIIDECYILIVKDLNQEKIIAMSTLVPISIFTSKHGRIEDVIVDSNYRGNGIAHKMIDKIFEYAKLKDLDYIVLTSSPARIAANNLYKKIGFKLYDTNVYYKKII